MVPEYARTALQSKGLEDAALVALVMDAQGRTRWVRDGFKAVTGYALEDLAGHSPGSVMCGPDTDPDALRAAVLAFREKRPIRTPILNYKKDRTPFWFDLELVPLFDDDAELAGFLCLGQERSGSLTSSCAGPYRVLVAEDHPINLKLVLALLQAAGCETKCAENGEQALSEINNSDFDLIIMDSQMPVLTGVEAISVIRRRQDWKRQTPIMSLTAHAMRGAEEYHTSAGADVYMSKPIRSDRFIGAVKYLARRGRDLRIRQGRLSQGPSASR
jgi:PAS domain S-box-containing protein